MRLWSLHPRYLDRAGLTACWREALLAQAVLRGETRGYRSHPQLERFRECSVPERALGTYLTAVQEEATRRGYSFDASKIRDAGEERIDVTAGQLALERAHLAAKLASRDPERLGALDEDPEPHPMFRAVPGPVASWERAVPSGAGPGAVPGEDATPSV